ncbi:type II toxin-antitoxin system RelE/ParE family toxin [Propionimicrobium sp. PCR01-08-3]|uniref:type II toxin-antitoxin system RelE/ParE family toxin n=1 Tax=Propionimicrobium sp. PCR01-08-3 TaxID=3052086 RepID=UPI00255D11F3|nr:type II toxin-antitoxin system RelE/ParE family toxin [Propionimicrobium sp. PCR01-08-3]WIY83090.1 type II toxin-antitoxin system RelE/ParE family toxin [Propionimicrobium sp. PCR01-08-3]
MTLQRNLHPEADAEFLDAVRYYEERERGLGAEFDAAAAGAVEDIARNPEAWPIFPGWTRLPVVRTRKLRGFPYRVVYFTRDDQLMVVAFAHQSRRPGYWKSRVASS